MRGDFPKNDYHEKRAQLIELGKEVAQFRRTVGVEDNGLDNALIKRVNTALIAVYGFLESGKSHFIHKLTQIEYDRLVRPLVNENSILLCSEDLQFEQSILNDLKLETLFSPHEFFNRVSVVEMRQADGYKDLPQFDAQVFILNAADPWQKEVWDVLENLSPEKQKRAFFVLSKLDTLHKKDLPVLLKHLEEKLSQFGIDRTQLYEIDFEDLFQVEELKSKLVASATTDERLAELQNLRDKISQLLTAVEDKLDDNTGRLAGVEHINEFLEKSLSELKTVLREDLLERMSMIGGTLIEDAKRSLKDVRGKLSSWAFIKRLYQGKDGAVALDQSIRKILSDALLKELNAHIDTTQELMGAHRDQLFTKNAMIGEFYEGRLDEFKEKSEAGADQEKLKSSIEELLRQLRLKQFFRRHLSDINLLATLQFIVSLVLLILSGICGFFFSTTIALVVLVIAVGWICTALYLRAKKIDEFLIFMEEWFRGLGPRLEPSFEHLNQAIIDESVEDYYSLYKPFLRATQEESQKHPLFKKQWQELYIVLQGI